MAIVTKASPLYLFKQVDADRYQQVALRKGKISSNGLSYIVNKGDLGGFLELSQNDEIRQKQIRDINASNDNKLPQTTWLNPQSSLTGDFKLPFGSIFIRSNLHADVHTNAHVKDQHAVVIDQAYLKNSNLHVKADTSVSIYGSDLVDCKMHTQPSQEDQGLFIQNCKLCNVQLNPVDSSQMFINSQVHNADFKGNSDIEDSLIDTKITSIFHDVKSKQTTIATDKASVMVSDSDLIKRNLTDRNAIHDYLIVKNSQVRGTAAKQKDEQLGFDL